MGINDGNCSVPGCLNPCFARGICRKHYHRITTYGSFDLPYRMTEVERFWSKVDKDGPIPQRHPELGPCWLWTGHLVGGYGHFRPRGAKNNVLAHRYAYKLLAGPIPGELVTDHICHDDDCRTPGIDCPHRRCVNPAHLRLVTPEENNRRQIRSKHCRQGHPLVEGNVVYRPCRPWGACRTCLDSWGAQYSAASLVPWEKRTTPLPPRVQEWLARHR